MRLGDRGGQLSLLLRRGTINNDDNYACMGFIVSSAAAADGENGHTHLSASLYVRFIVSDI